jgi:hypothetical protein
LLTVCTLCNMYSAASVGNRAPPHGGGASGGVLSSASDDDGGFSSAMREQLNQQAVSKVG